MLLTVLVDYSQLIGKASMVVDKLPKVNPPSSMVLGQGLLAAPILEAQRRWNREEITKKGYVLEGFGTRGKYRRRGPARGPPGSPGGPRCDLGWGRAPWPPGRQVG